MKNQFIALFVLLLLTFTFGCTGPLNQAYVRATTEETLLRAGFKSLSVTESQEIDLHSLPAKKITSLQRHGTIYYLYPDLTHNRLLMGKQKEFDRYQQLVTQQMVPFTSSSSNLEHDWAESGVWRN